MNKNTEPLGNIWNCAFSMPGIYIHTDHLGVKRESPSNENYHVGVFALDFEDALREIKTRYPLSVLTSIHKSSYIHHFTERTQCTPTKSNA